MTTLPKTIMIVDDEEDVRTTINSILKKEGYETVICKNGEECLEKLKKITPDLILMDIMMPGIPVNEIVKKIKGIKIVYVSSVRASDAEKEEIFKKGISGFIEKPFEIKQLREYVKKMVG